MKKALRERLLSKAVINFETGCWEWTASKTGDGYGQLRAEGTMRRAHRVAYELIEGPIPEGLQLDHLCRVRHCINPAHLEPVTPVENMRRAPVSVSVINAAKTRCDAGHEFTPENTYLRPKGRRGCRTCNRVAVARYTARQRERAA